MLYVLLLILITLTVTAYILYKDVLSPSFLVCGVFSVSCAFAIIGNFKWGVSVSWVTVVILSGMLLLIFLGELIARIDYNKFFKVSTLLNPEKTISPVKTDDVKYNKKVLIVLAVISVLTIILQYFQILKLAKLQGYVANAGMDLLKYARIAMRNGYSQATLTTVLMYFAKGVGFVCMCIFINRIIKNKPSKEFFKENWLLLIPTFCLLVLLFLSTSRDGFIGVVVMVFYFVIRAIQEKGSFNFIKALTIAGTCVITFFALFLIIAKLKGQNMGIIDIVSIYAGSPIIAFDLWYKVGYMEPTQLLFKESFWGVHYFISKLNPNYVIPNNFLEFIRFPNGIDETNIYTAFRSWIRDFGLVGCCAFSLFIGFAFGFVHTLLLNKKYKHGFLFNIFYSYFLFYLIYSFATPLLTTSFLTLTQIFEFGFIFVAYFMLTEMPSFILKIKSKLKDRFKKKDEDTIKID